MSFLKVDPEQQAAELTRSYGRFLRNYKDSLSKRVDSSKSKHFSDPLQILYEENGEKIQVYELLASDNKVLNKILLVFFHLGNEAKRLAQGSAGIAEKLVLACDEIKNSDNEELSQEEAVNNAMVKFSAVLEDLLNMKFLIQNGIFLAVNIIHQYCALFTMEKYFRILPTTNFPSNLDDVASLFMNFATFDTIFVNSDYSTYLQLYCEFVSSQEENLDDSVLLNLRNTLHELHLLLSGNIFQLGIDNLATQKAKLSVNSLKKLESLMLVHITTLIDSINTYDATISELTDTEQVLKLNVMIVIYQNLFKNFDPKNLRALSEINNKFNSITVFNFLWNGNEFLKKHVPSLFKSTLDVSKIQQTFMNQKVLALQKDLTSMYATQISLWILQVHKESRFANEDIDERALKLRCEIYYQGLVYAGEIAYLVKSIINLHMKFSLIMPKNLVQSIFKLIEYLQIIRSTFHTHSSFIVESIGFVFQYLQFRALNLIGACKKKVMTDAKKEKKFDLSSTLVLVENLLFGPITIDRLNAVHLALNLCEPLKTFGTDYYVRLLKLLDHIMILAKMQQYLKSLCDPSFLFWHQNLMSSYFKHVHEHSLCPRKIGYFLNSANICLKHLGDSQLENVRGFYPFVKEEFETNVIEKICNSIEINLRLDFHSNIQVEKFNPFETTNKIMIEDKRALIRLQSLLINNEYVSVREHVEHYLSRMFYNLTTISLKDWRTYGEMRLLAERKYSLETVDDHLPTQTLDHGLDVLEIMKNIHIFVTRYNYNLNNQVFVEQRSKNQHLSTVNIRNISNSLRTHGLGIINTAVNYVYQFLRKKFLVFSQFLYDERIKSRLVKDLKHHRDNLEINNQTYSYDRANAFNRDMKKLGFSENGETFLDEFRKLISQIGNSMGYIRMIRSGMNHTGLYATFNEEELEFAKMSTDDGLSESAVKAAEHLEEEIKQLSKNYEEGMLFFKLLVDTFAPHFRNPKNAHLRNFYAIIPGLTINYIEYILTAKDKLSKKNKEGFVFTDDGFPIGLIYVLKLLNQITEYNSLNWYNSIKAKILEERAKIDKQREKLKPNSSNDDKLLQTLLLSEKRLGAFQIEYELLFYNMSSAKIFFQN